MDSSDGDRSTRTGQGGWDTESLRSEVDRLGWYHSIDLGHGVVTPGMSAERNIELPDVKGRSVLDVGAWDGYYSFLAESLGASRVVALDHYVWGIDWAARQAYWEECAAKGKFPDHSRDLTDFWLADLPGKRGFDLACKVLNSGVESVVADFATADLAQIGRFDVCLFLGVLYHLKDPLSGLERLRSITGDVAVIETVAIHIHGLDNASHLQFIAGESFERDFGNWYMPTIEALRQMCLVAGFDRVAVVVGPPPSPSGPSSERRRIWRTPKPTEPSPIVSIYRALVHAFV